MKEEEAVARSLLLAGFVCGGEHFFFEDTSRTVYIPTKMMSTFDQVIEYMMTFAFHRFCTLEERKVYHQTAVKMKRLKIKFGADHAV